MHPRLTVENYTQSEHRFCFLGFEALPGKKVFFESTEPEESGYRDLAVQEVH